MRSVPVALACHCLLLLITCSILATGCSQDKESAHIQPKQGGPTAGQADGNSVSDPHSSDHARLEETRPTALESSDHQPQFTTNATQPFDTVPLNPNHALTFPRGSDATRSTQDTAALESPTHFPAGVPTEFPAPTLRHAASAFRQPTPQLSRPPANPLLPRSRAHAFDSAGQPIMISVPPSIESVIPTTPLAANSLPFSTTLPRALSGSENPEPRSPSARPTEARIARSIASEATFPISAGVESAAIPESTALAGELANATPNGVHASQTMPTGTVKNAADYSKIQVFYATDRQRSHLPLAAYELSGQKTAFMVVSFFSLLCVTFAGVSTLKGKTLAAGASAVTGALSGCLAASLIVFGQTQIEKHGVNYTGDRGQFTRGIAEVSIPNGHQVGVVERPTLLRFEVREDQSKHIVLTSAVELLSDDFQQRISSAVTKSPDHDLLVFIHGYNVSFESALLRTAQLAVDLPFEGVPVCYSWPSQATLTGYPIDVNNADWTVPHLKDFLLELATRAGADSISIIAHSMGNRAMTAAMRQISQHPTLDNTPPFDQIVLAAPDIDADHFRRDCAPALVKVANQVTLYASSDDQALIASRKVNGYPRAGDSGSNIVIVPGIETIDVSGTDLSLLGHSYYGDNESMLRDLYDVVRTRLPAPKRKSLIQRTTGPLVYWQLAQRTGSLNR